MAAKTLLPFGLLFAAGFLAPVDGFLRDPGVDQEDTAPEEAAAGFFFLVTCFILAIHADCEAFTRASKDSSSSNHPRLFSFSMQRKDWLCQ